MRQLTHYHLMTIPLSFWNNNLFFKNKLLYPNSTGMVIKS